MKQLPQEELTRIVGLLSTHSLDVETANQIHRAVKVAFANFSNDRKKGMGPGSIVRIDHHGQTFNGIVRKLGPKNIRIELEGGRIVTAHPTLVTLISE